ncbi:MAG: hypothetical protein JSS99_05635 [Actinobacteria bacterium]|nr:hypothetical protein [Actinomycetota bacterium]
MHFFLALAAAAPPAAPPAGGAALGQVAGMTAAVTLFTAALLWLGLGHRSGRVAALGRAADALGRLTGLPAWAALPLALSGSSLLLAVIGLYWDVSLHIDQGRDPGPLANPAHYFILVGLYGIFAAGFLAIALPRERPATTAVRIAPDWHAPVGGLLMAACASFALLGFPLDDVSHRLFGQDVTLWGPTHLMMLGGAALTLIAALVLLAEARLALRAQVTSPEGGRSRLPHGETPVAPTETPLAARLRRLRVIAACGGTLAGLSIFQGEFDYGVPQFSMLFHPLLIAFAAALALVLARTLIGRGGALAAVAFFLVLRGALALLVGAGFGETVPHFPPYVAEALLVEAAALAMGAGAIRSFRFGALAGALIATLGVPAEWAWSHVWMPLPWPAHILPEAIALALPVAIAGGVLGAFVAGGLRLDAALVGRPRAWAAAGASLLTVAGAVAFLLPTSAPTGAHARIALRTVQAGGGPGEATRTVAATIRFEPPSAVAHAEWLTVTAWQGRGRLVVDRLRPLGGGAYATTRPIPIGGGWKAMIRLNRGRDLAAIPLALPADAAIPVPAVPARALATRAFQPDRHVLQRERKRDVPAYLWGLAGLVVLGITSALLLVLGWGLVRLARRGGAPARPDPQPAAAVPPRVLTHA